MFRCDSSDKIGTGHLFRCLAFADKFQNLGCKIRFICKDYGDSTIEIISSKGYEVTKLSSHLTVTDDAKATMNVIKSMSESCELIVVDNYSLTKEWEEHFYPHFKILVIDDLVREHQCHYLLDNNYVPDSVNPYLLKCPIGCKYFMGPAYSLLRNEFELAKRSLSPSKGNFNCGLVFFGGTDATNETCRFLKEIKTAKVTMSFNVLVSAKHVALDEVKKLKGDNITLFLQPENPTAVFSKSDFYFGSSGTITWERLYLGIPGFVVAVADNQLSIAKNLDSAGVHIYLGDAKSVNYARALEFIETKLTDLKLMNSMRNKGMDLVHNFPIELIHEEILNDK